MLKGNVDIRYIYTENDWSYFIESTPPPIFKIAFTTQLRSMWNLEPLCLSLQALELHACFTTSSYKVLSRPFNFDNSQKHFSHYMKNWRTWSGSFIGKWVDNSSTSKLWNTTQKYRRVTPATE